MSNLLLIIVLGGISGILGSQILFPWLAKYTLFDNISWIRQAKEGVTIINRTENIVVTENDALEQAIDKTSLSVVGIISQKTEKTINNKKITFEKPETLAEGSGLIISNDGLVVTSLNLAPETAQKIIVYLNGKQDEAALQKRDESSGLALLKINENNLPSLAFREDDLRLGEEIFLVGAKINISTTSPQINLSKFIETSVINQTSPSVLAAFNKKDIAGAPLFDIKSRVLGINIGDANNQEKLIFWPAIKELLK